MRCASILGFAGNQAGWDAVRMMEPNMEDSAGIRQKKHLS